MHNKAFVTDSLFTILNRIVTDSLLKLNLPCPYMSVFACLFDSLEGMLAVVGIAAGMEVNVEVCIKVF